MILRTLKRYWYQGLKIQDYQLGLLSCKAMKWRGLADRPIHPKHLFDEKRSEYTHGFFRKDISFLDIGSGVGSDCLLAADQGASLSVGLEGNFESIATAYQRCRKERKEVTFIHINLEQGILPFVDNCFDLINFTNVLEHLDNRSGILAEIKRVKTDNGIVIISIPNANTSWKKRLEGAGLDSRDDPDHKIEYSKESLTAELAAADLNIQSELMPIIPSWPWNGLFALSAALSPALYKRLQRYKRDYVRVHPQESIGWVFSAI